MLLKILLFTTLLPLIVSGQRADKVNHPFVYKNSIQAELFGHGLFYSIGYERLFINGQIFKTTGQIGLSYYPPKTGIIDLWIPVVINELFSFGKHHIEVGIGHVFTNEAPRNNDYQMLRYEWGGFLTARLGYRYQQPNERFIFRAGFTPFLEYRHITELHPSGGLAIGYSFQVSR